MPSDDGPVGQARGGVSERRSAPERGHQRALGLGRVAQAAGDVLGGHETLLEAFRTDVRPALARARAALGAAEDPIAALRASGYVERAAAERTPDPASLRS
jgi:L-rhamnose isomerase